MSGNQGAAPGNHLKQQLAAGELALGLWVTLESASITEMATVMGLDWVCIDIEHGHLDLREVLDHVRMCANTTTTPLVRVPAIEAGLFKRLLDIGAQGLVVPQVRTAADAEQALSYCRYPPQGMRGIGGERATRWALGIESYVRTANQNTMLVLVIEHIDAYRNFDAILAVEGVDAVLFGPHDFAASIGHAGDWSSPEVWEKITEMRAKADAAGMPVAIVAFDEDQAAQRVAEGYRMIATGFDTVLLAGAIRKALRAMGREVTAFDA